MHVPTREEFAEIAERVMRLVRHAGFLGTSEKFRTLDRISFVNNHLQALAKNEG